jgi:hypothetical protein
MMFPHSILKGLMIAALLLPCTRLSFSETAVSPTSDTLGFNALVLRIAGEYPTDGTHGYWWPKAGEGNYDGCTRDLELQGKRVMRGEEKKRAYCCGLTLEVFLRAYKEWLKDHGGEEASVLTPENWKEFQRQWFVVEKNGPGPSAAAEQFGLGKTIPRGEARPGDFVQIWRTENKNGKVSGHSVIFLDWVRDAGGNPNGFRYWSTQPGTKGINEVTEHYGPDGGMAEQYTYFCRIEPRAVKAAPKTETEMK